jgi:hypothetical protein
MMSVKPIVMRAVLECTLFSTPMTRAAAQRTSTMPQPPPWNAGTSTNFFLMPGSGSDRSGLVPRANLNFGTGHTSAFLKKDPIGDELTFAYTCENAGTHGFFHTDFGAHRKDLGVLTLASADSPIGTPRPSTGSPTHRSCRSIAGTPARAHNRDSKSHPQPACPTPAS